MTSDERWRRVGELFDGALELDRGEREPWLRRQAPDDPDLRDEVMALVRAHEREGGVLETSPFDLEDLPARLERALAGRYDIVRELGRGGMAVVFLAWERKHDRRVVLKVLKPEIAVLYGADRFLREVQVAARLSHPHIIGFIDSGEADGLLYYVMPHVEGETLRDRLAQREKLPVEEAATLLRDIASALEHAHAQGVVHRDLKPGNVLCAGAHAYLMDFGVAKSVLDGDGDQTITQTGHALGTPRYMAPEQWDAAGKADARADLYAWGLLAYEMLVGRVRPVSTDPSDGRRHRRRVAREILAERPESPRALARLVGRCLEPEPSERPSSAGAVLRRLDGATGGRLAAPARLPGWLGLTATAAALVLAVVLAVGIFFRGEGEAAQAEFSGPVAVAAFVDETGDPALGSLGRLAGDWVTQGLQDAGIAPVIPWPTALRASEEAERVRSEGRPVDLVSVLGRETGAGAVVTGTVYRVGDRIQFRAEITDVRAGRILSAPEPITSHVDSVSVAVRSLRDRIVGSLAVAADTRLAAVPGLARHPPTIEAYRAFDRGLAHYLAQEYDRASPEFLRAYDLDTTFVSSLLYGAATLYNESRYAAVDSVLGILEPRRDRLNPYEVERWRYLGALLRGDGETALRAARRAAELAPGTRAGYNHALIAVSLNRPREAVAALEALDPDAGEMRGWAQYWTQLAHARHLLGLHDAEVEAARAMRTRHPERRIGLVLEVRGLAAAGRTDEVDRALEEASVLPPSTYWSQGAAMVVAGEELMVHGDTLAGRAYLDRAVRWLRDRLAEAPGYRPHRYWLGSALYDAGRWEDAVEVLQSLARDFPDRPTYRGLAAVAAARTGDAEGAVRWLSEPFPRSEGEHDVYRARLAALRGDADGAVALLADALRAGVDGMAWLHATAWRDFRALDRDPRFRRLMAGDREAEPGA